MDSNDAYYVGKIADVIYDIYNSKVNNYEDKYTAEWIQISIAIAKRTLSEINKAIETCKKYENMSADTDVIADIDAGVEDYPAPMEP